MDTQKKTKSKRDSRKTIVIVVIFILLIANGLLVQKNIQTIKQRDEAELSFYHSDSIRKVLNAELEVVKIKLKKYEGQSQPLDSLLSVANIQLAEKQKEIEKLLEENVLLSKLEAKFSEFQNTKNLLLAQVDSLSEAVKKFKDENISLEQQLKDQKTENELLENKIEAGSILRVENIFAFGFREKAKGVYSKTEIAKKVKKIEVCFDLVENKVIDKGKKDIYLRMINPKGSEIADEKYGSGKIVIRGSDVEISYTIKTTIQYNGTRQHLCMNWEQYSFFIPGDYKVELYSDGIKIGASIFSFK